MEDLGWEVRLYTRTHSEAPYTDPSYLGLWRLSDILTEYDSFQFTKILNDAGSGSITFDYSSLSIANRIAIEQDCMFAFCKPLKSQSSLSPLVWTDIVFGMIPETYEHQITSPRKHSLVISGHGVANLLDRSIVLPDAYAPGNTTPVQRPILAGKPLDAWLVFWAEAVARHASAKTMIPWGGANGQSNLSDLDSNGLSWDPALFMNIVFEIRSGTGLLELLKWAQAFGGFNFSVDFRGMAEDPIQMFIFCYQDYRHDLSDSVGLYLGKHHTSGKRAISRESVMSHLYSAATNQGTTSRVTLWNGDPQALYGKTEFFWVDAENYGYNDANSLGTKLLNSKRRATSTISCEIVPNLDYKAFIDYDIHDRITYDNSEFNMREKTTVMGLAVSVNGESHEETQEILLETPIETFTRRIYHEHNRLEQRFKFNSRIIR